jgi:hypothetical protein
MTNYAHFDRKAAPLSSEFGLRFARRVFNDEQLANVPLYVRGHKKGQHKGWLVWERCITGGWVRQGHVYGESVGHVAKRGDYRLVSIEVDHEPVLEEHNYNGSLKGENK